jgi:hypothetical protein
MEGPPGHRINVVEILPTFEEAVVEAARLNL